ncbi:putative glutathione S-transferase [Actinokineospora alba]|uniref:Putative glutathione S-transferase n=1 Tax=Actinokineospora alba TaxID=504798 RepID=A0A1H0VX69_9PSEU|nr:glutathione S-transferase family protein [Actinokineospora alba]TDP67138.1 putative glutathione S-transferase [Actinokineospora alba]SDJ45984.1 putative glutathione S-transferase [Actinokineospora alba]SDP82963.1 putative glutathione S-transferase [Actinokineospora alba]
MAIAQFGKETSSRGEFVRQPNRFTDRITADGSSGRRPEAGRYRLIVSLACPWAHRALIVRGLLGLTEVISLGVVDPIRDERGWRFTLDPENRDPVLGIEFLSEAYLASDPEYAGRVTVPALIDTVSGTVVSNDYPQITLDLSTEWREFHAPGSPDLYPVPLRAEIDALIESIFHNVNNGVYKAGFATGQAAYEKAYLALFAELDRLSARLERSRFLVGDQITEVDIRLFTTLVRFDAVYHGHFKCNREKLSEMPVLWAYARDLFQTPGFGSTVDFDHIKRHYYVTHPKINPTGVVPVGPDPAGWSVPHGRS